MRSIDMLTKKRCYNDFVDLNYARMRIIHKLTTTKYENCKAHTNKGYTILRWDTQQHLMISIQV